MSGVTQLPETVVTAKRDPLPSPDPIGGPGGFAKRKIELSIKLGEGDFGLAGYQTITLKGLRVSANIHKYGAPSADTADIRVYGMKLDLMNRLTSLGKSIIRVRNNTISISAGDDIAGMSLVFFGVIQDAWTDFTGMPDVLFNITAQTGDVNGARPVPPSSYVGSADAATIMQNIAAQMINSVGVPGLKFENNGVSVLLDHPYFPGTLRAQAEACARAAHIDWTIDGDTLAIWPMGGKRGGVIPLLTPTAGLVGYPNFVSGAIGLRSVYNPAIIFGGKVKVKMSSVTPANGEWIVVSLTHSLASETIGGPWFTDLEAYNDETGDPRLAG
jgi:hypothetical protein